MATDTRYAPALWNNRGTPLHDAAPSPRDLLAAASDPDTAIRTGIGELARTWRVELLDRHGPAAIAQLAARDTCPLPVSRDREGYYDDDQHLTYWLSGLGDALVLRELGAQLGVPLTDRTSLLDFGCSSGRVLRHVPLVAPGTVSRGVDLGLHNVRWARTHLPHLLVAQNTTIPTLPFRDGSFDVIFAGSVFTHISDFEEAWLLELHRILKPTGWAFLTFHPERLWRSLGNDENRTRRKMLEIPHRLDPPGIEPVTSEVLDGPIPGDRVVFTNVQWPVNNTNVIHSHEWVAERWGQIFRLDRIVEQVHGPFQDGALLLGS